MNSRSYYNGKSIAEDNQFALEVLEYINQKVNEFKEEDSWLYAIWFKQKPVRPAGGVPENVRHCWKMFQPDPMSGSFHCHVTESDPHSKQDLEKEGSGAVQRQERSSMSVTPLITTLMPSKV